MKTHFSMTAFRYINRQTMGDTIIKEKSILLINLKVCIELRVNKIQK